HLRMPTAVRELFELHRELDVGQRAAPQLQVELRFLARRNALALDPRLHAAHVAPPVLGERVAIDELLRELHEPRADIAVARADARFGERLELPRLRPLFEVGPVAAERARQRSLVAFGPQARVDAERASFRGAVADGADQLRGRLLRDTEVGRGRA